MYRHIAGEHLLIALHRDTTVPMYTMTPTGVSIWDLLRAWSTPEQMVEHLCERFDVTRDRAAADVADFLEQLRGIGALEVRESSS